MQATDGRLVLSPSDLNADYVECAHLTTLALEAARGTRKRPHYGAYEPTALKQLTGVYATREDAVDELLRREVLVDLHGVVRQGLRAGMPSYSLKGVEALATFRRRADVTSGTRAVLVYEQWMATRAAALLDEIAAYNEEDCRATLSLRDWLLEHRPGDAGSSAREAEDPALPVTGP